jgi:hypothetical protein
MLLSGIHLDSRLRGNDKYLKTIVTACLLSVWAFVAPVYGNEVLPETQTKMIERSHPRTGERYRVITAATTPAAQNYFEGEPRQYSRPDYRMLESDVQRGEIYYDGPVSSRKKVYIFAATVATLGTVGAASLPTVAATGSASGGAGVYAVGGGAVAAGTLGGAVKLTTPEENDDFVQTTKTDVLVPRDD